ILSILAHHDFHSFPTRRSSDLSIMPITPPLLITGSRTFWAPSFPISLYGATMTRLPGEVPRDTRQSSKLALIDTTLILPRPSPRSEEHTSELQSRFDLVCRLLL